MPPEKIKLTEEQKDIIKDAAGRLTINQIACLVGISKTTLYKIFERDDDVNELYKMGRARTIEEVSSVLLENALDGDTASIIFYLKTQAGWKETAVTELKGGVNISHEDSLDLLRDDE